MKNRIIFISFTVVLALSGGLIGCGGEEVPEITEYNLAISSTEGGEVTTPGEGTFSCDEGSVVDLVAQPDEGYHFEKWTGNVDAIADVYATETTITMNSDYSITANFALEIWEIRNWYDLDAIRDNLGGDYLLLNDLDSTTAGYEELAAATANGGKGWEPIGSLSIDLTLLPGGKQHTLDPFVTFTGSLDGQGYEIRDLFISRPDEDGVGLFGCVGEGGVVKNLCVVNAEVTGHDYVGGLVGGSSPGTVSNSYSTGNVTGGIVGGLVGLNCGTVSNSYSTGSVTGSSWVGGLVGWNGWGIGTVSNSYFTGSVTGEGTVGGLVGWNHLGTVSNSYSTGSVTGNDGVGGLVGVNQGTVNNSFWDRETSGQAISDSGTGKTTAEMKNIAIFTGAGWNIIAVTNPGIRNPAYTWNIVDGETYPFLSWQSVS